MRFLRRALQKNALRTCKQPRNKKDMMAVKRRGWPTGRRLEGERLPAATIVLDGAALLATLFRGCFVVAGALLPVRVVMVALVVALQAVRSVALGAGSGVRVFHDGKLLASQVVMARARMLAVLLLTTVGTPRVAECNILRTLVRLRGNARSRPEWVVLDAGDRTLAA